MSSGSSGSSLWRKTDAANAAYITALTGASQAAFPAVPYGAIRERMISNPSASNTIFVNLVGDAAVANGAGTLALEPLRTIFLETCNAITVIGVAASPITLLER